MDVEGIGRIGVDLGELAEIGYCPGHVAGVHAQLSATFEQQGIRSVFGKPLVKGGYGY